MQASKLAGDHFYFNPMIEESFSIIFIINIWGRGGGGKNGAFITDLSVDHLQSSSLIMVTLIKANYIINNFIHFPFPVEQIIHTY